MVELKLAIARTNIYIFGREKEGYYFPSAGSCRCSPVLYIYIIYIIGAYQRCAAENILQIFQNRVWPIDTPPVSVLPET